MLRSDRTRGSTSDTASSMATINSGSSSAKPQRAAWRCLVVSGPAATAIPGMLASDKRRSPLRNFIQRHGKHDDDAEENRLNARVDAEQVHRVRKRQQEKRPERYHLHPADAAF